MSVTNQNDNYDDENYDLLHPNQEQYFIFLCNESYFAIEALSVDEIIEVPKITKVPLLQSYVLGVTNIRGSMIGVIDLKKRVGLEATKIAKKTSLVISKTLQNDTYETLGFLIDEIYEVDGLNEESFIETPLFGTNIEPRFIKKIAKYNGQDIAILDLDKVLCVSDLSLIEKPKVDSDVIYRKENVKRSHIAEDEDDTLDDQEIDIEQLVLSNANDSNQYLIFRGPENQYYAKNVSKLQEVVSIKELEIAKNYDQSIVSGTANIRGEMLTLLNFDKWLGAEILDKSFYKEVIILDYGNHRFGLLVQETEQIMSLSPTQMFDNSSGNSKSSFITKIEINQEEVLCTVIDSDILVRDCFVSEAQEAENIITNLRKNISTEKIALFADDSKFIRQLLEKTAKQLSLSYQIFENGKLLLEALHNLDIDDIGLVITDIEMPLMDGKELIKQIRIDHKYDDLKIIVHTNMANNSLSLELKKIGADDVISKVDIKALSHSIAKYIR